jgi:integrase
MPSVQSRLLADNTTRYFVRVRDPRPGKKLFTSRPFATKPEAEMFCRDVENRGVVRALDELDRMAGEENEHTLDAWAEIHFDSLTKPTPDTVDRYRRIYRAHWSPDLGSLRLSQITRVDVARALNSVGGKDKTVRNAWGVLTHMLKTAVADGLIPRSPAVGIQLGRRTEHEDLEHRYLTHEEWWQVLDACPEHWRPLLWLLAGTGMRWGEMAALTVGDVDPEAMVVRITKAEKRDPTNGSQPIVGPTKSRKSRRTVTLPVEVVDAVHPLLGRPKSARLILPPNGGPLRHRTFYVDIWRKKVLAGAGLDDPLPRLHDLRHSHVAWLIAAGVPLPVIQQRLGHEKITTTIDTYGHLMPDVQRAAADAASMVLRRPPEISAVETDSRPDA